MHRRYLTSFATVTLAVACAEPATGELSQVVKNDDCEDFVCGNTGNSPEIDNQGLHELNFDYPNYRAEPRSGFTIKGLFKDGIEYIPHVEKATLTGLDTGTQQVVLAGAGLVDAELRVVNPKGTEYALRIFEQAETDYWAKPGGIQYKTPYYRIEWVVVRNGQAERGWKNICSGPWPEYGADTLNLAVTAVILFEGDRIDSSTRTVNSVDSNWLNIGCAGHALSKLHLSGHSQGAQVQHPHDFETSLKERTAFLRMMAADYCGTGPFTFAGQPLEWIDHRGWMQYSDLADTLEVRWTDLGASCLGTPRLLANSSPEGDALFKDIKASIAAACGELPLCDGSIDDLDNAHLVSANPLLP